MKEHPIVIWTVSCFDRHKENPLPTENKMLRLDWSQVSNDDAAHILAILQEPASKTKATPVDMHTTIETWSYSIRRPDWRMLRYRHYFVEADPTGLNRELMASTRSHPLLHVNLNAEYYEDEDGKQITSYEMMQHVTGQAQPIIVGDPESILRLGPVGPKDPTAWTQATSDTIAHFFEIVRRICSSRWYQSPHSISYQVRKSGEKQLLESLVPDDQSTMGVLAYLRQLHASRDKLFEKACSAYINQCSDGRKRYWIDERRRAFSHILESPPFPHSEDGCTSRQIMNMFYYGAGLLHSTSNSGEESRLAAFVEKHGKHKAVIIFNGCLMDILCVAIQVHQVIKQDFDYWIDECDLTRPGRLPISELFESFPERGR